jgi:hypothetical protein
MVRSQEMNQRIRLLAEQAGIYKLNLSDETEYWIMEKFAQLIVKECVSICQRESDDDDDQFELGRSYQSKEITELIKRHFGVEE